MKTRVVKGQLESVVTEAAKREDTAEKQLSEHFSQQPDEAQTETCYCQDFYIDWFS